MEKSEAGLNQREKEVHTSFRDVQTLEMRDMAADDGTAVGAADDPFGE